MSIAGDLIRGHTDAIILARLLQSDSYGYEINKTISALSQGRFERKEATRYTAFKRLEEQDSIASYWGDSGAGARRRYYCSDGDCKIDFSAPSGDVTIRQGY